MRTKKIVYTITAALLYLTYLLFGGIATKYPFGGIVLKLLQIAIILVIIKLLLSFIKVVVTSSIKNPDDQYHIERLFSAIITGLGIFAILSILVEQWTYFAASLGLIGFALTFSLQQPLKSLLGWVYITIKRPYIIGDRIQVGEDVKGDIIDIGYLTTTLWEVGGSDIAGNALSGRIIKLPNSLVLELPVFNYTYQNFDYVWNEIPFTVTYESDLKLVSDILEKAAANVIGKEMKEKIGEFREFLKNTHITDLELSDKPTVSFIPKESWVEARLRYLVHPLKGRKVKTRLTIAILEEFNKNAEKVKFPLGRSR